MPVISPRRYSTTTGSSSYLPPSVGGTTSSLAKTTSAYSSGYRSSSLSNPSYGSSYTSGSSYLTRTSSYRSSLYSSSSSLGGTSSYRPSSYLTGGNNDTSAASRFGVSSNRYTRSSSDRDTTRRITGKTQHNNNINTNRSKTLQTKPPIVGSYRSQRTSESRSRDNSVTRGTGTDNNKVVTSKSDSNNDCSNNNNIESKSGVNNKQISPSLSSSSLARQVATSGLDFYEKYSPAHYIPKCELSRSRSLSEATSNKYNNDSSLSNSSSNVHQLLHQKDNNKTQNKEIETNNQTSSSSTKDNSTTQLANKVKKLCAVTTSDPINQTSASSVVSINNNNITADANACIKYPLKANKSRTPHYLAGLNANYTNSTDNTTITTNAITAVKSSTNVVTNNIQNHQINNSEQDFSHSVHTNDSKSSVKYINNSSLSKLLPQQAHSAINLGTCNKYDRKLKNFSATAIFGAITEAETETTNTSSQTIFCNNLKLKTINNANAILLAAKSNLKPTKQFVSNKFDEKIMTNYSTSTNNSNNNNNNNLVNDSNSKRTPVNIINNTTISSTATAVVNNNKKHIKNNNILDIRLEFYKNKRLGGGGGGGGSGSEAVGTRSSSSGYSSGLTKVSSSSSSFFGGHHILSPYKDQNFLKTECELARSQVVKHNEEYSTNENNNNSDNNNFLINGQEKLTKYGKNLIKPLIHKTKNTKSIGSVKQITNNNMNCLQNSPELLDDIKYIDSDDSERQQHHLHHHTQQQHTSSSSLSPAKISERKDINFLTNKTLSSNSSSTLPLTSKHRDLIHSDNSSSNAIATAAANKYNTLNDFKRIPSNIANSRVHLINNDTTSSTSPTPARSVISGNLTKSNGTASRESTPSNSPQTLRRKNLLNSNMNDNLSSSLSSSPSSPAYSTNLLNDKKLSNKLCDIDESVRNASIRSALPPSPTPSRYWDREGRSSALAGRNLNNDTDDGTKSALNASNSYDKSSAEGLCGLRNIGNTCYMNSVIQCLSHTRELTKFLKTQMSGKSSSKDQQILYEFAKLIREMWTPNVRSVTPLELKSAFSSKHRMYSGYNQQDAQEFLRFFLDTLHCALNTGVKGDHLKIDDSLSDNKKADLTWEWYSRIENSVIRDLFVGQLKSTLRCTTCGNTSVTFDPFWDLSVPLHSSSRCKLDACLDLFIREEILDGDEMPTCSKCQTRRKCTKTFTIQRFPKYLVIHLKRFSETRWSKLTNIVEFPTGEKELNMAPYAANSNTTALYSLYGISNHMGSTAGGHYVALCKHPVTKKWHEFNDNVVSDDLSENVLVSSSAYLLFYERAH